MIVTILENVPNHIKSNRIGLKNFQSRKTHQDMAFLNQTNIQVIHLNLAFSQHIFNKLHLLRKHLISKFFSNKASKSSVLK